MKKRAMAILIAAIISTGTSAFAMSPGTYTGTGAGRNGDVTVEVEVDENQIINIVVTEHSETPGVGDGPIDKIPTSIVDSQSLIQDAVSGATLTSNAIMEAVEDALKQAGADLDEFRKNEASSEKKDKQLVEKEADVVVVGAGISGLTAAISAAQNGSQVIIVEKLPRTGGSAQFCSGSFASYNTTSEQEQGIEDSLEDALSRWKERTEQSIEDMGYPNYDRVEYILPETSETIDWLTDLGMPYLESRQPGFGTLSNTQVDGRGSAMIAKLTEIAEELGIEILLETPASELLTEDGAVTGIIAADEENQYTIKARNTILASGGFGANQEKVAAEIPLYANAVSLASSGNTGDGIEMAVAVGAVEYDSPWVIAYTIQPAPAIKENVPEASILTDNHHSGIFVDKAVVNENGQRFVDESDHYSVVSVSMAYAGGRNYLILDSSDEEIAAIMDQCLETGCVFKGETIEELAENADIDISLVKTIEQYNADAENGVDTVYGKEEMTAYADGPYYAVQYFPGMTGTVGGIVTDFESHVLNADGEIIEGLYAIGEMSNREYWNQTYIGATSVSTSATNGRLVGAAVSQDAE